MTVNLRTNSYPLAPMQQGMLFHSISAPNSGVDIQQIRITLQERLQRELFLEAWRQVADRHAILRTRFDWANVDGPVQIVEDVVSIPVQDLDWRAEAANTVAAKLDAFVAADRLTDFDLENAPLMRLTFIALPDDRTICLWTFHHILLDGRSFPIVLQELFDHYDALLDGTALTLETPSPFADYIHWSEQNDFSSSQAYWESTLAGFTAPTPLGLAKQEPQSHVSAATAWSEQRIPAQTIERLEQFARQIDVRLGSCIQGAWALLLHHYAGENDVVFGSTRAGRFATDNAADMVGVLINTVPMRSTTAADQSTVDFLRSIRQQQIALRTHENTPLANIQRWSDVESGASLFNTLVVYENYDLNSALQAQGGRWEQREFRYKGQTNFPLTLMAYSDQGLITRLEYDPAIYSADVIERMQAHFQTLLAAMPTDGQRPALSIPYLHADERALLVEGWNEPIDEANLVQGAHELFDARAQQTPDGIALRFGDESWTYETLQQRSNQVANYLVSQGVTPGQLIGLCIERSAETIIGMLGIMKAGGAYVPLDPTYPRDRLAHMVEDSAMPLLLTHSSLKSRLPENGPTLVCIDEAAASIAAAATTAPRIPTTMTNLVYVIYTSGSTGKPKGVQIPHIALTNFLLTMQTAPGLTADDVLVAVTTISFDIAALEIFLPLVTGATLVVASDEVTTDGSALTALLDDTQATVMQATPATWRMLLDANWQGRHSLKMLCGGEPLPRRLANLLLTKGGELWNMYGPTETTIWSTIAQVFPGDAPISIGRPIGNTTTYILDPQLQLAPAGAIGELCIGGSGVTHGYLNRPALTAEKFVTPIDGLGTLYRTGDLARFNPDGTLECLGRVDHQVKIRGFRIELGEIEAVLTQHIAVADSVVVAQSFDEASKRLVAYVIPNGQRALAVSDLRKFCKTKLPDYMVPAYFMTLDAFPLTNNGKVNRLALPKPEGERPELENPYVPPRTEIEKKIASVWESILMVNQIGVHDSFFELGGDSLLVVRALSQLRTQLNHKLAVHELFQYRTIRALALHVGAVEEPAEATSDIDSRVQKRQEAQRRRREQMRGRRGRR